MGRTRERAWRNAEAPRKKLKPTQKAQNRPLSFLPDDDDDDGDVELLVQSRGSEAIFQSAAEGQTDEAQAQIILLDDDDDGDVELLVQSRGSQAKFQSAAEGQAQTDEDQANEVQTSVEQNVKVSQDEDKVESTNSDVGFDQQFEKCVSSPSSQSLSGSTAYLGDCNKPGLPRNEKVLAEASKKILSSVTVKDVDIVDQTEIDTGDSVKEMNVMDDDSPEWAQALEPVRKLPSNARARIRRCIYRSLNRNPPDWAQEILQHSISKEVKRNSSRPRKVILSRPRKRAVISVLEKLRAGIPQPKPTEKKEKEKSGVRILTDDGDVEPLAQSRGPQAKFQAAAEGQTDEVQAQTVEDQAKEGQTAVEQNVNVSQDENKVQSTNSDVDFDQTVNKKCVGPPSSQLRYRSAAYPGYCNRHGSPSNEKLLDDDDVELLEPKQEECEFDENESLMSDSRAVISVLEKLRVDVPQPKPTEKKEKLSDDGDVVLLAQSRDPQAKFQSAAEGQTDEVQAQTVEDQTSEGQTAVEQNVNVSQDEDKVQSTNSDVDFDQNVNKKCVGPPSTQSLFRSSAYLGYCNRHGSPRNEKLLDNDDVELLEPKQEECEFDENESVMSDSLEKFSSYQSDIVCVQGYKVKRSIAAILKAIFKKHGDIAADCVFKTDSVRSSFLEVVCEVVRRIDMTEMVEDVESQLSDVEAANINVSWIRAHFEAFNKRKETSKNYSLLMEMKANTMLVQKAAQMDLRERCAELVAVQERFKNAERCVRVLHFVGKNLSDNIMESKAEIDSWIKHPKLNRLISR